MSICSLPRQQDSLNVLFEFIVLVSEQTTMGCTESVRGHVNALNVIEIHTLGAWICQCWISCVRLFSLALPLLPQTQWSRPVSWPTWRWWRWPGGSPSGGSSGSRTKQKVSTLQQPGNVSLITERETETNRVISPEWLKLEFTPADLYSTTDHQGQKVGSGSYIGFELLCGILSLQRNKKQSETESLP